MYCIYCGKEIPDDAQFCIHCGKECATVQQKKQTNDADVITEEDMHFKFQVKSNIILVRILIVASAVCCLLPFVNYRMGSTGIYRYACNGFEYMADTTLFSYDDELVKMFLGMPWFIILIAILFTIALAIGSFLTTSEHHRYNFIIMQMFSTTCFLYLFAIILMYLFKAIVSNASPNVITYPEPAYGLWLAFLLQAACAICTWPDIKFSKKVAKARFKAKYQSQKH